MKHPIIVCITVVFAFTTWAVPAARAAELTSTQQDRFDELVAQAVGDYSAGRYKNAISLFEKAFAMNEEPELLYNIARCYERLSEPKRAVEQYERFLGQEGTTGELRTKALENIASLRREIAALEASSSDGQQQGRGGQPSAQGDEAASSGSRREKDQKPSMLKTLGWTFVGVGGAGIVLGGIFGGLALSERSAYDDAGWEEARLSHREDAERNALIFDVGFFGGVTVAAVGAALLIVQSRRSESASSAKVRAEQHSAKSSDKVNLVPLLIADGNNLGLGLQARF
ncbi:MAG: hypothetical protein MUC50_20735 [Myxococcota bacterium]|jgi:tetratricopeptide (TPR) repeat protein|nr:hypothetical protein [Myxococcota bacterium]